MLQLIVNRAIYVPRISYNSFCTPVEEAAAKAEAAAKDLSSQQAVAVLGLALVAMGEDIGSEMLFRHFGHLLRFDCFNNLIVNIVYY